MIKFSSNSDFDFGIESVQIINGFPSQMIKRAGARELLKIAKTKGQTDLHVIAVGAYEGTGFNRNGDCFKEYWCEKNAHHFKDADRCINRHHKNKPEDPKYGNVKAAAYNRPMRRIELVVGLDDDKCGDILAEQEKVGHTNWSMASKQAFDICTACGHKAATDVDRCSHIPDKIGEITKEGQMIGMDNPNPGWFELSYVKRPADRIGMSLAKVASARSLKPMLTSDYLQIYTGFVPPSEDLMISKKASDKRALVSKLAEIEKHVQAIGKKIEPTKELVATKKLAAHLTDEYRKMEPSRFFKAAADAGIILSPDNFCHYLFGDRIKEAAVEGMKSHLVDIYQTIEKYANEVLHNEKYEPSAFATLNFAERNSLNKIAVQYSLRDEYVKPRAVTLNSKVATVVVPKTATAFDFELAKEYAAYKLAALNYLDENNKLTDNLLFNSILQNQ